MFISLIWGCKQLVWFCTESSYLKCGNVNNFYGWAMSQKLPANDFKWVEESSKFNEDFIKSYFLKKDKKKNIFLKLMFNFVKIYITFTMIYPFS